MFTSDKLLKRHLFYNLAGAAFLAVFGAVYEVFSHGVYSYCMLYAFAFPLVLGVLPLYLVGTRPAPLPKRVCLGLYHAGIATLTVGSLILGALEIYGTTSPLIVVYWIAGAALTLLGGLLFFTRLIREQGRAA